MQFPYVGAFFLCLQGRREKREDELLMLWKWNRGARVVGEIWERVDLTLAITHIADQVGYVRRKRKLENHNALMTSIKEYNETKLNI
jgi:hypothetical protein